MIWCFAIAKHLLYNTLMDKKDFTIFRSINNFNSREEWRSACWKKILKSESLLTLLTTPHERNDLVMRAAVMGGIISGKSYRKISEELWVSSQTISIIKKAVNEKAYRSYLGRNERKKRKYSVDTKPIRKNQYTRRRRTKYGTIHMPY